MNVAIIGAGLIGKKRAAAVGRIPGMRVTRVYDVSRKSMEDLAKESNAEVTKSAEAIAKDSSLDIVMVATNHKSLAPITLACVKNKKHVLVEKPGAMRAKALKEVLRAAKKSRVAVWVGYNHRYHPTIIKAKDILKKKQIGSLMYVRATYGHGGRKGYDREWRADSKLSGGGELLDQGSHLIDLTHYFFGATKLKYARLKTYFWDMPVEDNAFLTLETKAGQTAFLHASWTQWKNIFSFEIFGKKGAIVINGLGGSYGPESLTLYLRPPQGGRPKEKVWHFSGADESFLIETKEFLKTIKSAKDRYNSIEDAIRNLEIVGAAYKK